MNSYASCAANGMAFQQAIKLCITATQPLRPNTGIEGIGMILMAWSTNVIVQDVGGSIGINGQASSH